MFGSRMIVATVYETGSPTADRVERAVGHEFIRDGFSFVAAVFAPLWLLANRVWLGFAIYVAVIAALIAVGYVAGAHPRWAVLLIAVLHLEIGFEASSIRRWALEGQGWTFLGTVAGRTIEDCERRFYDDWLAGNVAAGAMLSDDGNAWGSKLWSRLKLRRSAGLDRDLRSL